jgi:hypothetical protein
MRFSTSKGEAAGVGLKVPAVVVDRVHGDGASRLAI